MSKTDKITRRILDSYENSNDSLLSVLIKELVKSHCSEPKDIATQTEANDQPHPDDSLISTKSNKKRNKKRNHGLINQDFKAKKSKKLKEVGVGVIAHSLEKMSSNISVITKKLDDFKSNPSQDESKSIVGHVGQIMTTLSGCIGNFEVLCRDIKQISETRNKSFDEWMDDLKNSENGRRFLKKLQKSFARVVNDEKLKMEKNFRQKLEREKTKLSKFYRSKKPAPANDDDYFNTIGKEINEIFQSTCVEIKSIEKESELLQLSLEMKANKAKRSDLRAKAEPPNVLNLDECQRIHSDGSDSSIKSDPYYSSESFDSDKNN